MEFRQASGDLAECGTLGSIGIEGSLQAACAWAELRRSICQLLSCGEQTALGSELFRSMPWRQPACRSAAKAGLNLRNLCWEVSNAAPSSVTRASSSSACSSSAARSFRRWNELLQC